MATSYRQIMRESFETKAEVTRLLMLASREITAHRSALSTPPCAQRLLESVNDLFWHHMNTRCAHKAEAVAAATDHYLGPMLMSPRQARQLRELRARSDASWAFLQPRNETGDASSMIWEMEPTSTLARMDDFQRYVLWPVAMRLHPSTSFGAGLLEQCLATGGDAELLAAAWGACNELLTAGGRIHLTAVDLHAATQQDDATRPRQRQPA